MQRKKTLLIGIIVLILLAVGGMYFMSKNKSVSVVDSNEVIKTTDTNGLFTSVKDAISKKMTLSCEFKDDSGTSTKSYIKNGAVRISSKGQSQETEFILKDKKMYMWDLKTKQGYIYEVPDSEGQEPNTETTQGDAYLNMIDQYKESCKVTTVEDSYFETPQDINFQDMSKLLEDLQKQVPQMPKQ